MAVFLHLLGLFPQCKYIESRGYLGAEMEEERAGSAPVALDLSALTSWKPQGHDVEFLGLYCVAYLSPSLPSAPVSIIPLEGLGTLLLGIPSTALV